MQQAQQNCFLAFAFLVWGSVLAPTLAAPAGPDPLLTEAQGPCDPRLDGPDYVPGTDADGYPVPPADMDQAGIPVPEGVAVPLGGKANKKHHADQAEAYAYLNHDQVASLLNPAPACPSPHKAH